MATTTEVGPCDCGAGLATLAMPIGKGAARWCPKCPNKPSNAIKKCECRRKKARFGLPGEDPSEARWCADCPGLVPGAVNIVDAARGADGPQAPAVADPNAKCVCGKATPTLALPIQPKYARWCEECPDKPKNAVPTAGRCECGRRKAPNMGLEGEAPKWCPNCPTKPAEAVVLVEDPVPDEAAPRQSGPQPPQDGSVDPPRNCVCGKTTANLALPIQLWLPKWCSECPERPRNACDIALRCMCQRRKASFALPGEKAQWYVLFRAVQFRQARRCTSLGHSDCVSGGCRCALCTARPEEAVDVRKSRGQQAPESDNRGSGIFDARCACGNPATLALPVYAHLGGKWCPECADKPRNAVTIAARCECGAAKAYLGLLEHYTKGIQGAKWCDKCPNLPAEAVNYKKRPVPEGGL
mmetsp:Transcript_23653/g.59479  ORF Transcript_23653/g.59479 Transcript_23653/m.59479 type:complete len:412 (-) Transcript_23653:59-1294(-)